MVPTLPTHRRRSQSIRADRELPAFAQTRFGAVFRLAEP
jgi:hypothetical protein